MCSSDLEAVDVILNGMRWLGLDWDEGPTTGAANGPSKGNYGPYFQSQRKENYQRRIEALLSRGLAYEHEGAIKFKMQREPITIPDLVVGEVFNKFDLILCRNVMIYFNQTLQNEVLKKFHDSLFKYGYLAIGSKESLIWCDIASKFIVVNNEEKVYKKIKD